MEQEKSKFLHLLRISDEQISPFYFGLLITIVFSLLFSRFLLTVSIITLACSIAFSLIYFKSPKSIFTSKNKQVLTWIALPAGVTIWYIFSFIYSENIIDALGTTKVKAIFLILPLALLSLSSISKKQISYLYHFFILLILIGSCWSLIQIPFQKINLTEYYARGWVIPTVIHHIRFSLLTAFATTICAFLVFRQPIIRLFPKYIYLTLALFLTVFLHILAVRSGLIGFYIATCFLVILSLLNGQKIKQKLAAIALALIIIPIAFATIPSLKSKLDYTLYSLNQFMNSDKDSEIGIYSDNRRLLSYKAAIQLIKENPVIGVGVGDIRSEMNQYYNNEFPDADMKGVQPHNQYLLTATAIGIPGAVYLLVFNLLFLFHQYRKKRWMLVAFNLIFLFSFLVEDTLEMQIGVIAYLFFNYLGWQFSREKTPNLIVENED